MNDKKNEKKQAASGFKKFISTLLLIALLLGAFYGYREYKAFRNRPIVTLAQAERASFNRSLNLNAQVEAEESQVLTSSYGLIVDKVMVKEGDLVEKGQELYRYSRADVQKQLRQTQDALAKMDEAEEERKERLESLFNDLAAQMSAQLGMSLQSSAALLTQSLANFDLKGQVQGLLPEGLAEWGLDPTKISTTISSLNQALNTGEATLSEIESLVQQISYSGITELTAANLYQLLIQSQSLYDQVQNILLTTNNLLANGLPKEMADLVSQIRDKAENLSARLAEIIDRIKDLLSNLSTEDMPLTPDEYSNALPNGYITEQVLPEDLASPTQDPLNGLALEDPESNVDSVDADSSGGGGNPAADDLSQANPALLLALLQMDQKQGLADRQKLEEKAAALKELLKSDHLRVKAEMKGLLASLKVTEGEAIEQGELEALILDNDQLIASCWVGKQDASRLAEGQSVVFHYDNLDLYGKITYKAAIASKEPGALGALSSQLGLDDAAGFLGSGVGAASPKVQVRMSIEGPDIHLLTIGFDINCEVEVAKVEDVLSIPVEALVQQRDRYYVYYVDKDQLLQKQEIELGLVGASRVEIKSGLSEHDAIVINAMSGLEVGQKVKVANDQ